MQTLDTIFKNGLSHAYLVRGEAKDVKKHIEGALQKKGVKTKGNPDCYIKEAETLSVDEAREISQFAALSPVSGNKYIFIYAKGATAEAQNALLKAVEEASGKSIFFFVLETGVPVLPTLLSRCVEVKEVGVSGDIKEAEEFLKMNYQERLKVAEGFQKDHDRDGARRLVRSLLRASDKKKINEKVLRDLLQADEYLKLSGSSPKGVVGHLALIL